MKKETKLMKKILKDNFPDNVFKVLYKKARSYYETSDKLIITTDIEDLDIVISFIKNNTKNIAVYRENEVGIIFNRYGKSNSPMIYVNGEWYDMDMLEFIEVRYVRI